MFTDLHFVSVIFVQIVNFVVEIEVEIIALI